MNTDGHGCFGVGGSRDRAKQALETRLKAAKEFSELPASL